MHCNKYTATIIITMLITPTKHQYAPISVVRGQNPHWFNGVGNYDVRILRVEVFMRTMNDDRVL